MSHFYGSCQGNRGQATRCGTKNSGYTAIAASWEGSVVVNLYYNEEKDEDWAELCLDTWQGSGSRVTLYCGPVSGKDFEKYQPKRSL